ncbi:MAG: Hsp20/alpha crystallin family protein [Polyangiales bacterium]
MLSLLNPRSDLLRLHRDLEEMFRPLDRGVWGGESITFAPEVDIREEEECFVVHADLPGMKQEDIEVQLHDGDLSIAGKREVETEKEVQGAMLRERRYGSFKRTFRLGASVDPNDVEAKYDQGVLTVTLPKRQEAKARQIPIRTS